MITAQIKSLVVNSYHKYKNLNEGSPAQYIPELAKVNPDIFGITLVSCDGDVFSIGDSKNKFTLQSASKPFVYSLALIQNGIQSVHTKVGVEPTGEAFNSIIELEEKHHRPFNPMINSGAIATTGLISGITPQEKLGLLRKFFSQLTNEECEVNFEVFMSEKSTAHRNRAIAHLMKHFSVMDSDIDETLDLYFQQCSLNATVEGLAQAAATLANKGTHPITKTEIIPPEFVTKTLSLMFTCGMYDSAGEWAFNIGVPAKSGVSGALFAVVPGHFGIAIHSPRIDEHGHSIRGQKVLQDLATQTNIHILG